MIKAFITEGDLSIDDLIKLLIKPSHKEGYGALLAYVGFVKAFVEGHKVVEVSYEMGEKAEENLAKIAEEVARKHGLHDIIIAHKEGPLKPGETVSYIVVTARTRHEAFDAVREAIDRVKSEESITKIERREDGEYLVLGDGRRKPLRK